MMLKMPKESFLLDTRYHLNVQNNIFLVQVGAQKPSHVIVWGPFIPQRRIELEKDIHDFVNKYEYPDVK